jgi:tetratricopeptide (TPR) repeat protein
MSEVARAALLSLLAGCAGPRGTGSEDARLPNALRPVPPDLEAAEARWRAELDELDAWIWYGRRLAYEGDFAGSVALFTRALERFGDEPELLRHRGHRFLSQRRPAEARADLLRAARALEGCADEVELDGAPNEFGIPRGTLHTNVWYHLGLAEHLLGNGEEAARAFAQCLAAASNDDFRVAAAYWRVLALIQLGRREEARALARLYAGRPLELMESFDYAALLELFAGSSTRARDELTGARTSLARATLAYGVARWHRLEGRDEEARALLESLVAEPTPAFGCLAAEVELRRMEAGR